jgi:hypothetical protein
VVDLRVDIDAGPLERWAEELSARGLKNAVRRATDQSARAARKTTVPIIAKDIGVSPAKIKAAVPKVKATTNGSLVATWTISKLKIGIRNVQGAVVARVGGLSAATHRLTGGGSAALSIPNAFLVKTAAGGTFVAYRKGGGRLPIKSVYAETPATAMGQGDAVPRTTWEKAANAEIATRLPREVQRQFFSERLSAATPDTSD